MSDSIDQKIRDALAADSEHFSDDPERELSLFDQVSRSFRGRHRWLVTILWVSVAVYTGLLVVSGMKFLAAEQVRDMLLWGGLFGFSLLAIVAAKIWYWMELNRSAVTREIKRVELQIVRLAEIIESGKHTADR